MAKIYMNDFRVTTSVVPVLRYLDGNKTDELVIFTDDKMTDFDTHIALIDNNVVKLFANESGFAAIIDKDIFNEKDVCPIRLVFSNSETEKKKAQILSISVTIELDISMVTISKSQTTLSRTEKHAAHMQKNADALLTP